MSKLQDVLLVDWACMLRSLASEMMEVLSERMSVRMALFEWHRNLRDLDFAGRDSIRLLSFDPLLEYPVYQQYTRRYRVASEDDSWVDRWQPWTHTGDLNWMLYCGVKKSACKQLHFDIFSDLKQKACSILAVPEVSACLESPRIETARESHKLYAAVLDGLLTTPYQLVVATDGTWWWTLQSLTPRNAVRIETLDGWSSPIMATAWLSSDFVRHSALALRQIADDLERAEERSNSGATTNLIRSVDTQLHADPWLTGAKWSAWQACKKLSDNKQGEWFTLQQIADETGVGETSVEYQTLKNLSKEMQDRGYFIKSTGGQGFRAGTGRVPT